MYGFIVGISGIYKNINKIIYCFNVFICFVTFTRWGN